MVVLHAVWVFTLIFIGSCCAGCLIGMLTAVIMKFTSVQKLPLVEQTLFTLLSYVVLRPFIFFLCFLFALFRPPILFQQMSIRPPIPDVHSSIRKSIRGSTLLDLHSPFSPSPPRARAKTHTHTHTHAFSRALSCDADLSPLNTMLCATNVVTGTARSLSARLQGSRASLPFCFAGSRRRTTRSATCPRSRK